MSVSLGPAVGFVLVFSLSLSLCLSVVPALIRCYEHAISLATSSSNNNNSAQVEELQSQLFFVLARTGAVSYTHLALPTT